MYSHRITDRVVLEEVLKHSMSKTYNSEIGIHAKRKKVDKKFEDRTIFQGLPHLRNRHLINLPLNPVERSQVTRVTSSLRRESDFL